MTHKDNLPMSILTHSKLYYPNRAKTLKLRLESVNLGEEAESKINSQTGKKILRDKVLGLSKITEIVSIVLNWNEEVEKEIRLAKKEHLLNLYFDKADHATNCIDSISKFLSNPQGNILFNKILRIQDDSPPDLELSEHLSSALKHITESDYLVLFEEHRYALSIIEKLTPQEMSLITRSFHWGDFNVDGVVTNGSKVTSDWIPSFLRSILATENKKDEKTVERLAHAIHGLERSGLIAPKRGSERSLRCELTSIGKMILPYLQR